MINLGKKSSHSSDYVKESKALFALAAEGKIDGFQLADKFFDMDKKYPGLGWGQAARKIYNRWAKPKGISLI